MDTNDTNVVAKQTVAQLEMEGWQSDGDVFDGAMGPGLATDFRQISHPRAQRVKLEVLLDEEVYVGVWEKYSLIIEQPGGELVKEQMYDLDHVPALDDVAHFLSEFAA
jgi:hypothetical protein